MSQSQKSFIRDYALTCYVFDGNREDYLIAKLINKYMKGKRVLDLGCGPVVSVMSIFYPDAKEAVAVDKMEACLDFVKNDEGILKEIIGRAKSYRKKYLDKKSVSQKISLVKGDVTKKLALGKFDAVMQIGCFGALDTEEGFQTAVNIAYSYLKPDGKLLMVNWIGDAKRPYHFNGKVDVEKLYVPAMKKAGLDILECHTAKSVISKETKQMGYDKIIWAVGKK